MSKQYQPPDCVCACAWSCTHTRTLGLPPRGQLALRRAWPVRSSSRKFYCARIVCSGVCLCAFERARMVFNKYLYNLQRVHAFRHHDHSRARTRTHAKCLRAHCIHLFYFVIRAFRGAHTRIIECCFVFVCASLLRKCEMCSHERINYHVIMCRVGAYVDV